MQKFGFLNYGLVKDVMSRGFDLQCMFHACTWDIMAQASGKFGSGDQFPHHRDGILSRHRSEYCGEPMAAYPSHFQ